MSGSKAASFWVWFATSRKTLARQCISTQTAHLLLRNTSLVAFLKIHAFSPARRCHADAYYSTTNCPQEQLCFLFDYQNLLWRPDNISHTSHTPAVPTSQNLHILSYTRLMPAFCISWLPWQDPGPDLPSLQLFCICVSQLLTRYTFAWESEKTQS